MWRLAHYWYIVPSYEQLTADEIWAFQLIGIVSNELHKTHETSILDVILGSGRSRYFFKFHDEIYFIMFIKIMSFYYLIYFNDHRAKQYIQSLDTPNKMTASALKKDLALMLGKAFHSTNHVKNLCCAPESFGASSPTCSSSTRLTLILILTLILTLSLTQI
jgi:hypothetical protein